MPFVRRTLPVCLALLLGSLLIPARAQAQEGTTRFGVEGGLTLAKLENSGPDVDSVSVDYDRGFAVGLFLDSPLGGGLSLQPALLYERRTGEVEFAPEAVDVEGDLLQIRMSYVELPLLLRYTAGDGSVRPVLFAGPAASLNLKAETRTTFGNGAETTIDIKDEVSDFDLGVALGAGLQFGESVSLDARYTIGLLDVDDTADPDELKWRTFLFALGFTF